MTDKDGSYRFSLLPPGDYELTVEAVDFVQLLCAMLIQITEVRSIATQLAVAGEGGSTGQDSAFANG